MRVRIVHYAPVRLHEKTSSLGSILVILNAVLSAPTWAQPASSVDLILIMSELRYLKGYPEALHAQVQTLIAQDRLGEYLLKKYPKRHQILSDNALYDFANNLKKQFMRNAPPLEKVFYDSKIKVIEHALGQHHYVSRVQGGKLKASNFIKIASVFKSGHEGFLRMILAHELAHFKEKEHSKAFYQLCRHIEPDYHQLELDTRLYLLHLDMVGELY